MRLPEYSIARPITVLMVTLSVMVLGFISLGGLPLTMLPEFSSSSLSVFVSYPSSAPEEVERHITRPLEEVLSTLENLENLESTSSNTGAYVRVEFKLGTDMDMAALEVRDRIDQVRNLLPEDIDRVSIRRWQTTDRPVFRFAIAWDGDRDEFFRVTEDIVRRHLERIDGVANIEVRGLDPKQVIVDLNESRLQSHGVDVFGLSQSLRANNISVSGGYIVDGEKKYTLRTIGELETAEEVANIPIQGGRLLLKDVADVRFDFPDEESFARLNGKDSVSIYVYKASTANVVSVCGDIRDELEVLKQLPQLEGRLSVQIFSDQSEQILSSLNDLKTAGIYGGLLAMVVLFLFLLKVRSALIVSVAIPVSVIFTFAFLYMLRVLFGSGISLNIVSLMGLMVAVGMLVDNSVVVLENIYRYKQEKGLSAKEAAARGSREVGVAVLASTATTVAVFMSFLFVPNAASSRFNADFGTTVSVSLIASLVVALTLVPMIASRVFTGKERPRQRLLVMLSNSYGWFMNYLLRWRFVSLILMALIGYASYVLFISIDREMLPSVAEREVEVDVFLERSFSIDEIEGLFAQMENALFERKEELEIVSISSDYSSRGRGSRRGVYQGELEIYLKDEGDITPTMSLRDKIIQALPVFAGVEYKFGRMRRWGGGGEMGVTVEVRGEDPMLLSLYAEEVKERMAVVPGIKNIQTSLEAGDDEIHLSVDRDKVEKFGVSSLAVARTISSLLSSRATTRLKGDNGELDVIMQLDKAQETSPDELLNMSFQNRDGEMVPFSSVVDYEYQRGPLSIRRNDRKAMVQITAETSGGGTFFISQQVQQELAGLGMPPGYSWSMGRNWHSARESEEQNLFAILFAVLLMYMIMAALFESFLHPFTILLTVPFSIIGVAILFYLTGTTLNQMAYLGILVLFGIVVNNGIILIDHINFLRRTGSPRREAIIQGGMDRLRPILMTASTSLFGLLPLTLPFMMPELFDGASEGAAMWAPVSLAVLGGLTTSTFLTLIILPPIYSYMDDLNRALRWLIVQILNPAKVLRRLSSQKSGS